MTGINANTDRSIVKAIVHETLLAIGINADDPIEAQSDFMAMRDMRRFLKDEENKKDLVHLRKWRNVVEQVESKATLLMISALIIVGLSFIAKVDPSIFMKK